MTEIIEALPERAPHKRYISLGEFVHEMMGKKSKNWYYDHMRDPDFPQRVYLPGSSRPVLDYDECVKWQERATKTPPWHPRRR